MKRSKHKKTDKVAPAEKKEKRHFKRMTDADLASLAIISIVFIVVIVTVVKMAETKSCPSTFAGKSTGTMLTGNVIMPLAENSRLPGNFCYDSDATYGPDNEHMVAGYVTEKAVSRELMKRYSDGNDVYLDSCMKNLDGSPSPVLLEGTCIKTLGGNTLKAVKRNCKRLMGQDAFCVEGEYGAYCSS